MNKSKTNGGTTSANIPHNKGAIKEYPELLVLHANVWMFYVKRLLKHTSKGSWPRALFNFLIFERASREKKTATTWRLAQCCSVTLSASLFVAPPK